MPESKRADRGSGSPASGPRPGDGTPDPAFDARRVAAVGRRIARGRYRIHPERIAAAMLARKRFAAMARVP